MRTLSPRIAPPLNGEVGSTAITPSDSCSLRATAIRRETRVDFPAPGAPVIPTVGTSATPRYARAATSRPVAPAPFDA